MKKITLIGLLCFLLWKLDAQTGICLEYDNAGNRIFRHDCISMLTGGEEQSSLLKRSENVTVAPGEVLAFPNPTNGKFQLRTGEGFPPETAIIIYDGLGRLLSKRQLQDGYFDISTYSSGTYYLRIVNGDFQRTLSIIKSDR